MVQGARRLVRERQVVRRGRSEILEVGGLVVRKAFGKGKE